MGTMREELVASMLREFNLALMIRQVEREASLAARADQPPVWRWSPGTFVFPEGLCCYCGGVMLSPCIWRVVGQQFHGSWKVVDGGGGLGHFEFDDSHPHVSHGSICMGSGNYQAGSVADALFLAFNPTSMYFGGDDEELSPEGHLKGWFADRFNHTCGFKLEVRTIEGVNLAHAVAPEEGCHCTHCRRHRGEVQCPRPECGEWYGPNRGHGEYSCRICGDGVRRFCVKHQHQVQTCTDCGDRYDLWDTTANALAVPPTIIQCETCEAWVCDYCMSKDADSFQHKCMRGMAAEVAEEVDHEDDCHHECCRVCCVDNGCDLVEAGWDSDDEDEDDGEDEPFVEEVSDGEEF